MAASGARMLALARPFDSLGGIAIHIWIETRMEEEEMLGTWDTSCFERVEEDNI